MFSICRSLVTGKSKVDFIFLKPLSPLLTSPHISSPSLTSPYTLLTLHLSSCTQSLVYEDGVLVSGSLQALVQHAVPTAVYYPDTAYLFAFLLSSRLFVKPHELLQRVCEVGFTQQGLKDNDLSTIKKVRTRPRPRPRPRPRSLQGTSAALP